MEISNNLSSMMANQTFMNANANNVANVNSDGFVPTDTKISEGAKGSPQANLAKADDTGSQRSQTNLTKELTDQIVIEDVNEVNVAAIKTQNEMFGTLLDIKA